MDEYDPTRGSGKRGHKGERFDACGDMLRYIDEFAVRLRRSEEGQRAMAALERAIKRMRAAGYGQKDQDSGAKSSRFELAVTRLEEAKRIGFADRTIKDTFRLEYQILLSEEELFAFSNFLVVHYPDYPSWSETDFIKDYTRRNEARFPLQVYIMKKPESKPVVTLLS